MPQKNILYIVIILTVLGDCSPNPRRNVVGATGRALQKILLYYEKNYANLNVDGVFGFRIAEGILKNMILSHGQSIPNHIHTKTFYSKLQKINFKAIERLKIENSSYYQTFKKLIESTFYLHTSFKEYDQKFVRPITVEDGVFGEEESDKCLSALLMKNQNNCLMSRQCWDAIRKKGTGRYFITHQALFFIIANYLGCSVMKLSGSSTSMNVDELYQDLGSNIFSQMRQNFQDKHTDQDLFLEQTLVCNLLGIKTCNQMEWMNEVLRWQDDIGCVKDQFYDLIPTKSITSMRRLHVDVLFKDGCSSHATGLFITCLSLYWRWLLRTEYHVESNVSWYLYTNIYFFAIFLLGIIIFIWYLQKHLYRCYCKTLARR